MQTLTLNPRVRLNAQRTPIPVTARGRALYTIDWFLNGKPVLSYHDNPRQSLRDGLTCY